jgi:hypothetical protein
MIEENMHVVMTLYTFWNLPNADGRYDIRLHVLYLQTLYALIKLEQTVVSTIKISVE